MRHLCLLICRVDEEHPEELVQLQRLDLPSVAAEQLQPETALDDLETATLAVGHQVMRRLLEQQWQEVDAQLVAATQRSFPPADAQS